MHRYVYSVHPKNGPQDGPTDPLRLLDEKSDPGSCEVALYDASLSGGGSSEVPSSTCISQKKIQQFLMKEVRTKLNHGLSVSTTEDYLRNVAALLGDKSIPTQWNDILRFMKSLGYTDPKHYKVCVTQDHSYLPEPGEECGLLRFGTKFQKMVLDPQTV